MDVSSDWAIQTAVAAAAHLAVVANREAHAPPMKLQENWMQQMHHLPYAHLVMQSSLKCLMLPRKNLTQPQYSPKGLPRAVEASWTWSWGLNLKFKYQLTWCFHTIPTPHHLIQINK